MKNFPGWLRVLSVLVGATLLACLLFPPVRDTLPLLGLDYPPGRVFRRIWMISVVLGLIVFARWLGMLPPSKVGYRFAPGWWVNLLIGIAIAWAYLGVLAFLYVQAGIWYAIPGFDPANDIFEGFLRGLLVSGIEEYIFRGLIFLSFCKRMHWVKAAVVCSLIFSSLHFIEGRGELHVATDQWWSGFAICGSLLYQMGTRFTPFPNAVSLFIVAMILCYALKRTGTLWYGAGLHGGWVWSVAVFAELYERNREWEVFWVASSRLFDGVIPLLGMLIVFPVTVLLVRNRMLYITNETPVPLRSTPPSSTNDHPPAATV